MDWAIKPNGCITEKPYLGLVPMKGVIQTILMCGIAFVCPPPTASGHGSKEHGYHWCTRIGHLRILIPIILGFKSAFGAILKDFGRYASLVGER